LLEHDSVEDWTYTPKRVVRPSQASRNSVVAILPDSIGTSEKLRFKVSKKVPPGGTAAIVSVVGLRDRGCGESDTRVKKTE
jgi:hypothetical protein